MLKIDTDAVSSFLNDIFSEKCSVNMIDDPQTRFTFNIEYSDFSLVATASDARICLNFKVNEFDDSLRNALLVQLHRIRSVIDNDLKPYKLMLWANENKDYKNTPDIETLKENPDFIAEVCTGPCDITTEEKALKILMDILAKSLAWVFSVYNSDGEEEGERHQYLSSRVERSSKNRALCIALHGYKCQVCETEMKEIYGKLAEQFIHVHHLESIAIGGKKWIDPQKDLITVCPNCHSMLHRSDPPIPPEELKRVLGENRN